MKRASVAPAGIRFLLDYAMLLDRQQRSLAFPPIAPALQALEKGN
jgi:hypothetical protein